MAIVSSADAGLRAAPRATILQLRAPALTTAELEREAVRLVAASPVPVLISSRVDVALACGAAGVNLPERDIATADARELLGDGSFIGRSVHSLDSALDAQRDGADYVIFGPVWQSASHPGVAPVGIAALSAVARAARIPVLAIGGVTQDRIAECHRAGAAGYAAIGLFA
ncbi:MAG TPA: thiamine phosphate synthase [Candidatus Limnocylindrales bacterium]|nr:thiamine phosphate synthase [Candidatus Limnocylindrales bacterium]